MHFSRPVMKIAAVAAGIAMAVTGCASGDDSGTDTAGGSAPVSTSEQTPHNECGGMSIDHEAPITRSSDIVIDAPLRRVWDVQTDVESWHTWQDAVLTVERLDDGDFSAGSRFRWTTPVPASRFSPADTLTITSSVQRLTPGECVLWEGPAVGKAITIDKGTHLWRFTETNGRTRVHTEESWDAALLESLRGPDLDAVADMLGGGLDVWLQALKTEAEAKA